MSCFMCKLLIVLHLTLLKLLSVKQDKNSLHFFLCDNLDLHFHKKQYHIGVCVLLKNLKRLHILGKTHMWFYVCVCVSIYIYRERERETMQMLEFSRASTNI